MQLSITGSAFMKKATNFILKFVAFLAKNKIFYFKIASKATLFS